MQIIRIIVVIVIFQIRAFLSYGAEESSTFDQNSELDPIERRISIPLFNSDINGNGIPDRLDWDADGDGWIEEIDSPLRKTEGSPTRKNACGYLQSEFESLLHSKLKRRGTVYGKKDTICGPGCR